MCFAGAVERSCGSNPLRYLTRRTMLMKLTHDDPRRPRGWLRRLGRLVATTAVYMRPGMPTEHVQPVTERGATAGHGPTRRP